MLNASSSTKPVTASASYDNNENNSANGNNPSNEDITFIYSSSGSSSENENGEVNKNEESKIHIGPEYQANLAKYDTSLYLNTREKIVEKETAVWKPNDDLDDSRLDDYINEAINKRSYTKEQALVLLFWNNYDLEKSYKDMVKFVPKPNDWTHEEKILFEQAYWLYGKNFNKIRQVLPDKTQGSLVTFYYNWKKNRSQISAMDAANNKTYSMNYESNNGIFKNGTNEDYENSMDSDDSDSVEHSFDNNINQICCNCDLIANDLQSTPKGLLCHSCYVYWKESGGLMRPESVVGKINNQTNNFNCLQNNSIKTNRFLTINNINGTTANSNGTESGNSISKEARNFQKSLRKPPKGIFLDYDELVELAETDTDKLFDQMDKKIFFLKKQTQASKQEMEMLFFKVFGIKVSSREDLSNLQSQLYKIDEVNEPKVEKTLGWTSHEVTMALLAFNKYGDDLEAISDIIKTKSQSSIKAFYNYYKDNLNLDKLIFTNSKALTKRSSLIANDLLKMGNLPTEAPPTDMSTSPSKQSGNKLKEEPPAQVLGDKNGINEMENEEAIIIS